MAYNKWMDRAWWRKCNREHRAPVRIVRGMANWLEFMYCDHCAHQVMVAYRWRERRKHIEAG